MTNSAQDYITIYSGATSLTAAANARSDRYLLTIFSNKNLSFLLHESIYFFRWCGGLLEPSTTHITVLSARLPFHLLVSFDGTEVDNPATAYENSKGFYLYYSQTACS